MDGTSGKVAGLGGPMDGTSGKLAGPGEPMDGTSGKVAGPGEPMDGTSGKVTGPGEPTDGTSGKVTGPGEPTDGTSGKVAGPGEQPGPADRRRRPGGRRLHARPPVPAGTRGQPPDRLAGIGLRAADRSPRVRSELSHAGR